MKYLLITIIRNFTRKPVTNLINLVGLSISLALVIILSVYCYSELTTDNFHKNGERVYLYGLEDHIFTPGVLKEHIDLKIPVVEATIRVGGTWEAPVFQVENKEPLTIVITKKLAGKLFGKNDAIGKPVKLNNGKSLIVSAVIEESKANSCLNFSAVTNIATRKIVQENGGEYTEWGWCDFQTFLLLKKGVNPAEAGKAILSLFPEENRKDYLNTKLTPLKKVYFSKFSLYGSNYLLTGDRRKVQILLLVASLVLIIALINFINISSSQWREKIRQTGVMKVVGATRSSILVNILGESFLFFLAALFIGIQLVNAISPLIRNYTGIQYDQKIINSPGFIIISLVIIIVLSIAFSIIPALRISSSSAVDNLKKTVRSEKTSFSSGGLLVTIQFAIAIVLISFTMLVQKQVRFGSNNLGFNQSNILGIRLTDQLYQKKDVLKNLLEGNSAVRKISFTQFYPGSTNQFREATLILNGEKKVVSFDMFSADPEFFEMLGLQLVSGRLFTDDLPSEQTKIVVNETFLRDQKIANPLGAIIKTVPAYEIVGVIKDFHYKAVNQPIGSLAIRNDHSASYCLVTTHTSDFKSLRTTVDNIKRLSSELSPSFPVEVSFFDEAIRKMYQSELMFRRTFSLFAICAIIISCMGILAMSIFASQRRVREIGIRKVNGAKIYEILMMLNKDFVKWVGIAFVIACPVAWYTMHRWLESFAYRTELSWWIFMLAGLLALGIALITVSWQSWRAATRNPVEALRYE